jgi:dTDP-D-glucose 4,6-dehydratase
MGNTWHLEILGALGKPQNLISFVKDRPGHDQQYAIDSARVTTEPNWLPEKNFASGLVERIRWYRSNEVFGGLLLSKRRTSEATEKA